MKKPYKCNAMINSNFLNLKKLSKKHTLSSFEAKLQNRKKNTKNLVANLIVWDLFSLLHKSFLKINCKFLQIFLVTFVKMLLFFSI